MKTFMLLGVCLVGGLSMPTTDKAVRITPDQYPDVQVNLQSGGAACSTLSNFKNTQYTVEVEIGDGQKFKVIPDTGSAEVLVSSSKCINCPGNKAAFDPSKSSSFKDDGKEVIIRFGQGDVKAVKGYDKVAFGSKVAQNQSVLLMKDQQIRGFEEGAFDGVFGLSKLTTVREGDSDTSWTQTAGVTAFGICLSKNSGGKGVLLWDAPNVNYKMVNIVGDVHWGMQMSAVSVGSNAAAACTGQCGAIIDSGTSLIAGPAEHLEALGEQVGEIKEDCSNLDSLPTLKFTIDGNTFDLPPRSYILNMTGDDVAPDMLDKFKEKYKGKSTNSICLPAFMPISLNSKQGPVWILGMPFLRHYMVKFDKTNQKVGIAEATPQMCNECGGAADASAQLSSAVGANAAGFEDTMPLAVSPAHFLLPDWARDASKSGRQFVM